MDARMKKKLTLGLAHLMGPHKGDDRIYMASPPPSPYPGRRAPLSSKVETDLRAACTGVLVNTKPSHLYVAEDHQRAPKPQLDYEAVKTSAATPKSTDSRPAAVRSDSAETSHAAKHSYRSDAALEHLSPPADSTHDPVQASIPRRKGDAPSQARQKTGVSSGPDASGRSRPTQRSASAGTSGSTPQTDMTEYPWSTSTAPTSAAITPARASKRASSHIQAEPEQPTRADLAAIEWMRNELERRRKKHPATDEHRPAQSETRAPSRARSIRNNIKEYIRPSTAASRESSRPVSRSASRASRRPGSSDRSTRGWRSWGLSRKDDTNLSRSNSNRGRSETRKGSSSHKPDIDLNRELPPLPGLDQWKAPEPAPEPAPPKQHVPGHRQTNSKHSHHSKSIDSKMSEKDEIIAARLGSPIKQKPEVYQPTRSIQSSPVENRTVFVPGVAVHVDHVFTHIDPVLSPRHDRSSQRSKSTTRPQKPSVRAVHPPRAEDSSTPISPTRSTNYSRVRSSSDAAKTETDLGNVSAGFSKHRNYDSSNMPPALSNSSAKKSSRNQTYEQKYRHVIGTRSPPPVPPPKEEKKWWHLKAKSKKPSNWMDQLEKMGIKDGVLVNDDACGTPVIRY